MALFGDWRTARQQKRQRESSKMIEALKKGDRVVTSGGFIGTVVGVQTDYLVLKLGENDQTKVEVLKSAISGLREAAPVAKA